MTELENKLYVKWKEAEKAGEKLALIYKHLYMHSVKNTSDSITIKIN